MTVYNSTGSAPPGQAVVTLQGASGAIYGFTAFPLGATPRGGGIYILAQPTRDPRDRAASDWTALCIGETGGFSDQLNSRHVGLAAARKLGATHVLVHFCGRGQDARRHVETDLISALRPVLNARELRAVAA